MTTNIPAGLLGPTQATSWSRLLALSAANGGGDIARHFADDPHRAHRYTACCGDLFLDYSKNRLDDAVVEQLLGLAREMCLSARIRSMFAGDPINTSEGRPALHVALRGSGRFTHEALAYLPDAVSSELNKIRDISDGIRTGVRLGVTGKAITDVINIGIGGSDIGPKMVCNALREYSHPAIRCHFVANVDGAEIHSLLAGLDPETTLVVIASKSFTTHETMLNATTALAWFERCLDLPRQMLMSNFIGITENIDEARKFGIYSENIFTMWDWVGGRYSLWSSIGLTIAISIGFEHFSQLLAGAAAMDEHFYTAPFAQNMPVILALVGIWYRNFLGAETQAVVPYCQRLADFISHLQQLDMESNGKSVSVTGQTLDYATGMVVWGQPGTNGQHSFFQLIHQGSQLIPVDFIAVLQDSLSEPSHHDALLSHMLAQAAALMQGSAENARPEQRHPGNRPSNVLLLKKLTPYNLGSLIALYEHKVFTQGVIWNINSFDQWGVELGKSIARQLLAVGQSCEQPSGQRCDQQADPSTSRLLGMVRGQCIE